MALGMELSELVAPGGSSTISSFINPISSAVVNALLVETGRCLESCLSIAFNFN